MKEDAAQVDRDDVVEDGILLLVKWCCRRQHAGVVDSAMQAAIGADSRLDQCLDLYTVGYVGAHEQAVAAFAFGQLEGFIALVADDDLGAMTVKRKRGSAAQARPFR